MTPVEMIRALRYRVEGFSVVYDTGTEFWSGQVVDASDSGMFIETSHRLENGTEVTIIPDSPLDDRLPFEIRAVVVRAKDVDLANSVDQLEGMAFRFWGMSEQDLHDLQEFLREQGVLV